MTDVANIHNCRNFKSTSPVLSSKTMEVVDKAASSMVKLAGGVVEDLGDFFVQTIDQLPKTIEKLSSAVGKAVEDAFASLVGKFIGVTYKNANNISTAFNNGISA
ncbi:hypothetical protein Avbf_04038 [Armadillidium vulgare]|nr:hypothetical protein Avbf_04038 [Armadillidium vulgare]